MPAMFNKTDEKVKVKVTQKGEKIKTKFAPTHSLGITVPGSKVNRRPPVQSNSTGWICSPTHMGGSWGKEGLAFS